MKNWILTLMLAGLAAIASTGRAADPQNLPRVGNLAQLDGIRFEGQEFFTDQELRRTLRLQMDYVLATEPDAPLPPLLEMIQKLLRAGYQTSGFADATVSAGLNSASNQVVVRISEGPRLYCGAIRVEGLKQLSTNAFLDTLNQQLWPGWATNRGSLRNLKGGRSKSPLWRAGCPASLDPASWAKMELVVTNTFWQLGYLRPQFIVDFPRRPPQPLTPQALVDANSLSAEEMQNLNKAGAEGRLVDLLIQVTTEGPGCTVAGIRALGTRNAGEDLAKFLGVRTGEPFTEKWRQQQLETLLESGRFTQVTGSHEGGETDGRVTAILHLEDLPEAPPLTKALTENAQALLRARRWLLDWTNRTEDLVWQFGWTNRGSGTTSTLELVCTPNGNFACQIFGSADASTNPSPNFQFIVSPGNLGIWVANATTKFHNTNFSTALQLGLDAQVVARSEDQGSRGNLTFFFGFNTESQDKPPLTMMLKTMPAAMVYLAQESDLKWSIEDRYLIGSKSNFWLQVDATTGRLVALKGKWETPRELANWNSGGEWGFSFKPGRFARAEADWARYGANLPNAYDPVHAVGSGMAYLAGGLAQTKIIEHLFPTRSPSVAAHARTAFTKLFGVEFFSGFEKLLPDLKHSGGNRMGMPLLSDSLAEQGMQALRSVLAMFLVQVPEVVPTNTWLEAALKLPLLSFSGHASRIEPLMNRLVNGQQLGPVACLLLGREIANPQATRQLAIMGLLCADSEGFLKDARAFMDRKVAAGQMTASLARSLANLNDDELQALAFLAGEKQGKCLAQAAVAVRQAGGPELDVVLEPLLVQWWNTSLKEPVKTELRKLTRARD